MRSNATARSIASGFLSVMLSCSLAFVSLPAFAAPPKEDGAKAEGGDEEAPAPAGEVGGRVSVLKFTGSPDGADFIREGIDAALAQRGYEVSGVKKTFEEAADRNKCKKLDEKCEAKVGAWLAKNSKTPPDFYVYGEAAELGKTGKIVVYDIKADKRVKEILVSPTAMDAVVLPILPYAVADDLADYQRPPGALSADEEKLMASLDEPEKTAEEIAAEEAELKKAQEESLRAYNQGLDVGAQQVDLKKDFEKYCRKGKPEHKIEVDPDTGEKTKIRDLHPACKRGKFFGYWQPRSWVALTLTLGSAAGMGLMYGLAAASRSEWNTAKTALEDSGLTAESPETTGPDGAGRTYQDYAGDVSEAGSTIRRRAIIGDVLLGTTVLLFGITAIIVYQDRQAAKRFIQSEKELNITNLRVGPMMAEGGGGGASVGFDFGI